MSPRLSDELPAVAPRQRAAQTFVVPFRSHPGAGEVRTQSSPCHGAGLPRHRSAVKADRPVDTSRTCVRSPFNFTPAAFVQVQHDVLTVATRPFRPAARRGPTLKFGCVARSIASLASAAAKVLVKFAGKARRGIASPGAVSSTVSVGSGSVCSTVDARAVVLELQRPANVQRSAVSVSPSRSVELAVSTRLPAARLSSSFALVASGCLIARSWSSVTVPSAATLTVKSATGPPAPAALRSRPLRFSPARWPDRSPRPSDRCPPRPRSARSPARPQHARCVFHQHDVHGRHVFDRCPNVQRVSTLHPPWHWSPGRSRQPSASAAARCSSRCSGRRP